MAYIPQPLFDSLTQLLDNKPLVLPPSISSTSIAARANADMQQALAFLKSYRGSEATFNAYRRDIERLLHWSWSVACKDLTQLKRADIEAFMYFCQRPPQEWIATQNAPRFIDQGGERKPNPDWRPFVVSVSKKEHRDGKIASKKHYQLSQSGIQATFATLSSFFNFMIAEDYVEYNPVAQIRQKSKFIRKHQQQAPVRRLSELQWEYVIETAQLLAQNNPAQHERSLFIMTALYGMYLRVSELAASSRWTPTMGDFAIDGDGNWWFTTVGKGNKQRNISVSDAMLAAFKRYRLSLGLSELPAPGENLPLIPKTRGAGPVTGTRQIRRIVQQVFDAALERLRADGFQQDADTLSAATVHWLRHTGISEDVKIRPREHVRDDAGHGSSAITDRYIDIELRARHASAKHKKIQHD